jgi:hypothetical protein
MTRLLVESYPAQVLAADPVQIKASCGEGEIYQSPLRVIRLRTQVEPQLFFRWGAIDSGAAEPLIQKPVTHQSAQGRINRPNSASDKLFSRSCRTPDSKPLELSIEWKNWTTIPKISPHSYGDGKQLHGGIVGARLGLDVIGSLLFTFDDYFVDLTRFQGNDRLNPMNGKLSGLPSLGHSLAIHENPQGLAVVDHGHVACLGPVHGR